MYPYPGDLEIQSVYNLIGPAGGGLTNTAYPDLRIRILLVLPQATERTGEDILGWVRVIVRKEDTTAVVEPLAGLALDLGVID